MRPPLWEKDGLKLITTRSIIRPTLRRKLLLHLDTNTGDFSPAVDDGFGIPALTSIRQRGIQQIAARPGEDVTGWERRVRWASAKLALATAAVRAQARWAMTAPIVARPSRRGRRPAGRPAGRRVTRSARGPDDPEEHHLARAARA